MILLLLERNCYSIAEAGDFEQLYELKYHALIYTQGTSLEIIQTRIKGLVHMHLLIIA